MVFFSSTFFAQSFCSLNPSEEEVNKLQKEIDQDGDGEIEFNEFLEMMNSKTLR